MQVIRKYRLIASFGAISLRFPCNLQANEVEVPGFVDPLIGSQ